MTAVRTTLYGDPTKTMTAADGSQQPDRGFYGLRGRAALDAAPHVLAQLENARQQLHDNLGTADSQLAFDRDTRRFQYYAGSEVSRHADQQADQWYGEVEKANKDVALANLNDAVAHNNQSGIDSANSDLIGAYVKSAQRLSGGDPTVVNAAVLDARRLAATTEITGRLKGDPAGAQRMLEASRSILSPQEYNALSQHLEGSGAADAVERAINGTPPPAGRAAGPVSDPRGVMPLIRQAALKYGIDPEVAGLVARSEGLAKFSGDGGSSGTAFQLHVTPGGRGNHVGDQFARDTGLNPLDPENEPAAIDYALRYASQHGWGAFHGAARSGIGDREGIGERLAAGFSRDSGGQLLRDGRAADVMLPGGRPAWTEPGIASATMPEEQKLPAGITRDASGQILKNGRPPDAIVGGAPAWAAENEQSIAAPLTQEGSGYRELLGQHREQQRTARATGQPPPPTMAANVRADFATALARLEADTSLNAQTRQKAIADLHARYSFTNELATREEADSARQVNDQQKANWSHLMAQIERGQPPDNAALADMLDKRQLDQGQFASIQAAMAGRSEVDDPGAYTRLNRRARAGEDITDDVSQAIQRHQLKPSSGDSLLNLAESHRARTADQVERGAFAELRTIAGGDAVEKGMLDFGNAAHSAQIQLWSQAQDEWNKRVVAGKEDPMAVLADMSPRYSHPVRDIRALPNPRLGAIQEMKDLPVVAQKTQQAFDNGQLSPDQFRDEQKLLLQYRDLMAEQQKRQEAAEAAAKKAPGGGARLRGLHPAGEGATP
jgi:hypothetical protein